MIPPVQTDPKQGERDYYTKIGAAGLAHSIRKPFSDEDCAKYLAAMTAIFALLPPPPARVVEFGCGTGWLSLYLAERGYEVLGVDISADAVAQANIVRDSRNLANAKFLAADYESFSGQESFDCAVFHDALHHAEDERAALQCCWNALKPNGIVITIEPGVGHSKTHTSLNAIKRFGVHEKDMPPKHIIALAQQIGFRRSLVLPNPHDLNRSFYRNAYLKTTSSYELFTRWLLGVLRALRRICTKRNTGLVLLWK